MFDRQQFLNDAYTAIIAQGKPSIRPRHVTYTCMYRGGNGLKCAIGHMIPDDKYHGGMELKTASNPDVQRALGINSLSGNQGGFLDKLQACHDQSIYIGGIHGSTPARASDDEFIENFKAEIKEFVLVFDLQLPA